MDTVGVKNRQRAEGKKGEKREGAVSETGGERSGEHEIKRADGGKEDSGKETRGWGYERGREKTRLVVRRAQQETFNSVTPGLNYHAETIVSGKIKKGVLSAAGRAPHSRFFLELVTRAIVFARAGERGGTRRHSGGEKGTTSKSLFRLRGTGCCARFNPRLRLRLRLRRSRRKK